MLNVFTRSLTTTSRPETLAVVDLGSNSFRLEIGRVEGEQERAGEQRTLDIHKFLQPQADG